MKYLHITGTATILLLASLSAGQIQAASFNPMANKQQKSTANNYIGASAGMVKPGTICDGFSSCDDGDKSWKIYSGVRLNDSLVIEGGYIQFGELTATDANNSNITSDLSGYTTAALATYQYSDQIELFGKGGMIWWDNEQSDSNGKSSNDGSSGYIGIGANYDMGDNLGIKAEWERFEGIERFQGETGSMDLLSIGATMSSL